MLSGSPTILAFKISRLFFYARTNGPAGFGSGSVSAVKAASIIYKPSIFFNIPILSEKFSHEWWTAPPKSFSHFLRWFYKWQVSFRRSSLHCHRPSTPEILLWSAPGNTQSFVINDYQRRFSLTPYARQTSTGKSTTLTESMELACVKLLHWSR